MIDVFHAQTTNVAGISQFRLCVLGHTAWAYRFYTETDNGSQCYIPFVSDACINVEHSFFFLNYFNLLVWLFNSFSSFTSWFSFEMKWLKLFDFWMGKEKMNWIHLWIVCVCGFVSVSLVCYSIAVALTAFTVPLLIITFLLI